MKGCAGADGAHNMNLAGVLLDDAVGDREAESRATAIAGLGCGLGGEKRIVDALQMLGRDARAGVCHHRLDMAIDCRGHAQTPTFRHGLLGVQQQVEEDLLQFAGVAVDGRQLVNEVELDVDLRGLELVIEQRQRVADDLVQIGFAELRGLGAREVEQPIRNLGGAEALLRNFIQHRRQARIALQLL